MEHDRDPHRVAQFTRLASLSHFSDFSFTFGQKSLHNGHAMSVNTKSVLRFLQRCLLGLVPIFNIPETSNTSNPT